MRDETPLLIEIDDQQGPVLTEGRGEGGTWILKDQALCPFRAFAHYRLRGQELDRAQPGIDAMTRGNLLHRVMETFWAEVGSQHELLKLEGEALEACISRHVVQAIDDHFPGQFRPQQALLDLEQARLCGLVREWLVAVELDRDSFSVEELEQEHFEQIGPLKIRTVIDRIDRLEGGQRAILDYKTGQSHLDGLLGERLLEPQLPIYAIADSDRPAEAVAFARVQRGACKLIGIASGTGMLPGVAGVAGCKPLRERGLEAWGQLLESWRRQLEQLATDFVDGVARVDPVSYDQACQFCDLAGLCRIAEADYLDVVGEAGS